MINDKYHYVYKIISLIDNKYYIGKHSSNNLNDNYLGSGKIIKRYINKYGRNNFKKEILKFFNNSTDAYNYEKEIVNENLLNDPNCLNLRKGGLGWDHYGDNDFINSMGQKIKNTVVVKDKDNNYFRVNCNDERIKNGELIYANKGIKRSDETKEKLKKIHIELHKNPTEKMKASRKIVAQKLKGKPHTISEEGKRKLLEFNKKPKSEELKQKLSNKIHVCKLENNKNLHEFIDKEKLNEYLNKGWVLGMYAIKRVYVHKLENNNILSKRINNNELENYLNDGWIKGRGICTFNILDENGHMKKDQINKRKNRIHIYKIENNTIIRKLIKKENLSEYLINNWIIGKPLNLNKKEA